MREDFLHYVWQYKKFEFSNLTTTSGEQLMIINVGHYLQQPGPDFFNAQLVIGNQKWAGNVEIHVKSSDWYLHHHAIDPNYQSVILHVVWEHDTPIFRKDNSEIPALEIKKYVSKDILENYNSLRSPKSWINCESRIANVDGFVFSNWQERLFFERLERKSIPIQELLMQTNNDWEAVLFCMLAKNFGLNTNGETFLKIAQSIPFSVIRKVSFESENLESLLFGIAGLFPIDAQDSYTKDLKSRFEYILQKHQLEKVVMEPVQFLKHRPGNFPTIRLAQLAQLYHKKHNLFSEISSAKTVKEIYKLFEISVSEYWLTHYQFDKESTNKKKQVSKAFVDLLIINAIIPIQFAFAKSRGKEISESLIDLIQEVGAEKNAIVEKFAAFGIKARNAFETQSLLQLKNEYCNHVKCLQCAVGIQLLKE